MDKHIDQTRIHNSQFVCFRVDREWVEDIMDDNAIQMGLKIVRPDGEEKWGEPTFPFKLENEDVLINGRDFQGGLFVMASVKPEKLQQAIAYGLTYMLQSGQLPCDAFFDRNGHEEA